MIDHIYLKDKNGAYRHSRKDDSYVSPIQIFDEEAYRETYQYEVLPVDLETFEPINETYSKDANFIYYEDFSVQEGDPATASMIEGEPLDSNWLKDKDRLYYRGDPIDLPELDLETISIIGYKTITDSSGLVCGPVEDSFWEFNCKD